MRKKIFYSLFILSAFLLPPFIGEQNWWPGGSPEALYILTNIRLPRILFAFVVGGGLALVGTVFQALLRNDLATPYTLGVSSGGALGAVLAIKLGLDIHYLGFSSVTLFSMAGSFLTLFLIYLVAWREEGFSGYTLILAGVSISLFFSAFILFVHYLADFTETYRMVRWLMGALDVSGWQFSIFLLVLLVITFAYFYWHADAFNIVLAGDDLAKSKGVDVKRLQLYSFLLAALLVGGIVSLAGPISFIGLIVPHMLRIQFGANHRRLFPAVLLFGGAFLIWCDTLARQVIFPAELPVGVITALVGAPFFVYLLVFRQNRN